MKQPTLHTVRLTLRPFTLDDAPEVQRLAGDKAVAEPTSAIPHPYLDGMAESWIKTHRKYYSDGKQAIFAITLGSTGELLGTVSLTDISRAHRRAELGYWLGRDFWGQGYMTEAARAIIGYGFSAFGLNRIHARCLRRNPASARVLEKIGMQREACLRQHECKAGGFEDILLYGMLASEFRAAR